MLHFFLFTTSQTVTHLFSKFTPPRPVAHWDHSDVVNWAKWISAEFGIAWWNMDNMNGARLVTLTCDEFLAMWPQLVGEVPWEHLVHLKQQGITMGAEVLSFEITKNLTISRSNPSPTMCSTWPTSQNHCLVVSAPIASPNSSRPPVISQSKKSAISRQPNHHQQTSARKVSAPFRVLGLGLDKLFYVLVSVKTNFPVDFRSSIDSLYS